MGDEPVDIGADHRRITFVTAGTDFGNFYAVLQGGMSGIRPGGGHRQDAGKVAA